MDKLDIHKVETTSFGLIKLTDLVKNGSLKISKNLNMMN